MLHHQMANPGKKNIFYITLIFSPLLKMIQDRNSCVPNNLAFLNEVQSESNFTLWKSLISDKKLSISQIFYVNREVIRHNRENCN